MSSQQSLQSSEAFDWNALREQVNKLVLTRGPRQVGIVGIDVYFPSEYVSQAELEEYDGVGKGKYCVGLGQKNMAVCDNREDIVSMCLTVVENLLTKYNINHADIGRIEVGTETIADKSKSVKTFIMSSFNKAGCYDIQGVDTINACYGGTSAVFNAVNWIESSSWDGRYAIVVAGDIAVYEKGPARPTGGAGVIALLIGPHAPITLETSHISTHMEHVYDFYKPHMDSEYPVVDGKLSNECYMRSIDSCYHKYKMLYERATKQEFNVHKDADFAILHSPYSKLVEKSFARLSIADAKEAELHELRVKHGDFDPLSIHLNKDLEKEVMKRNYEKYIASVMPTLQLSQECGNMYTGSVYASLCSLINSKEPKLNKRSLVFSYGSGSAASMFSLKFLDDVDYMKRLMDIDTRLEARQKLTPEAYTARLEQREQNYKNGVPIKDQTFSAPKKLFPGTYYVQKIDPLGRRTYGRALSTMTRILRIL